jgi:hypothetical protein
MIDDKTFYTIKDDFLDAKSKLRRDKKTGKLKSSKFKAAMLACHLNVYVSEVEITVIGRWEWSPKEHKSYRHKEDDFDSMDRHDSKEKVKGCFIPLIIDGVEYNKRVKKIVVRRLMTERREGGHASIPICTYQPLKKDDSLIRNKVMS